MNMSTPSPSIPYEKQTDPQSNRGCGAACLSMVYRSFGKEVPQATIWPLIVKQNRQGSIASTTHLMAQHAAGQGFAAIAIQARHPLQVLRLCRDSGIRAILNHRLQPDSPAGHYTVLVDVDDHYVVLHDPFFGPARRVPHQELLDLWQPKSSSSEILGNMLIGISDERKPTPACEFCHTEVPSKVDCPRCKKAVSLDPGSLLGCVRDGCIARMWNYVCCPSCDFMWSFSEAGVSTAAFPPSPGSPAGKTPEPVKLDALFIEIDRFCNHIASRPAAAGHTDLQAQLEFIRGTKDRLRTAQVEQRSLLQAHVDRLAAFAAESHARHQAHEKKLQEMNAPTSGLDGEALSDALLKNLGFK